MQFSLSLAILGLAAFGQAHNVITIPVPFKESDSASASGELAANRPLDPDGKDFPCRTAGTYTPQGPSTPMALGSTQPIKFMGGATHGGGSCQISITYDKAPSKSSVWKVIHSIEGGCPMSIEGNLSGDRTTVVPTDYTFPVPNDLPTGEAVLAWTWFNRIGNREMYMNCAPITITGGSTRRDEDTLSARNSTLLAERDIAAYNSLPDMYQANIFSSACQTPETFNVQFPNPGSSVLRNTNAIGQFATPPVCQNYGGGAAGPAPSQPESPASSASPSPAAPSIPGGVFLEPKPTSSAQIAPTATAAPVLSPPASSAPVQAPPAQATTFTVIPTQASSVAPPASTGSPGGGSALTGSCPTEGQWNCIGGSSFQRCASGTWSVVQDLAAGTACTPGQGTFSIHAVGSKRRAVRFSGAHIRRHLRSS